MRLPSRPLIPTLAAFLTAVLTAAIFATPASAAPTGIPSKTTAQTYLNALTVAAEANAGTYDRDLFPHWTTL